MINLLIMVVVAGVVLWLIESVIPMDPTLKTIARVIVIVAVVLAILSAFVGGPFHLNL